MWHLEQYPWSFFSKPTLVLEGRMDTLELEAEPEPMFLNSLGIVNLGAIFLEDWFSSFIISSLA